MNLLKRFMKSSGTPFEKLQTRFNILYSICKSWFLGEIWLYQCKSKSIFRCPTREFYQNQYSSRFRWRSSRSQLNLCWWSGQCHVCWWLRLWCSLWWRWGSKHDSWCQGRVYLLGQIVLCYSLALVQVDYFGWFGQKLSVRHTVILEYFNIKE